MRRLLPFLAVSLLLVGAAAASASALHGHAHKKSKWHAVYKGDFSSGYSKKIWTRYNGTPTCCSATRWSRSHLVAKHGIMNLQNYRDSGRWLSAGMSMGKSVNLTYGKWSVRFRMDRGGGVGMCLALWPEHGWPPEVDFAEESSRYGSRRIETGTLHYGPHNSQNHARVNANFSKWHVMSVELTPHKLVYLLDGKRWHTVTGSAVPHQPMHLFMQTHVGSNGSSGEMPAATLSRHVDLHVDWVRVYRWVG
jgi:beta-glucanase (GH16 family)